MPTGRVTVMWGKDAPLDVRVLLDGHEVRGLVSVSVSEIASASGLPVVTLVVEPESLVYEGPAHLQVASDADWRLQHARSAWPLRI
jgi:hypothetical protein